MALYCPHGTRIHLLGPLLHPCLAPIAIGFMTTREQSSLPLNIENSQRMHGRNDPTDPCNALFTRGGNTHTHYEPTAPRMRHVALHMTQQTEQTHPGNHSRLNPGTSASISRHTQLQTHDPIRESREQNHTAFCRPPRYIIGGIYAHA
jgi:hypothetical protein